MPQCNSPDTHRSDHASWQPLPLRKQLARERLTSIHFWESRCRPHKGTPKITVVQLCIPGLELALSSGRVAGGLTLIWTQSRA